MQDIIMTTTAGFSSDGFPLGYEIVKNPLKKKLSEDEILLLIEHYQPIALIAGVEPLTENVLSKAKNLRVISRVGIGLDSIDLKTAKKLGISVVNTPDAPTQAVAEFTIGMMLSVLRKIPILDRCVRVKIGKGEQGHLLHGKTVGIIGCGRIGSGVGRICSAFGCNLLGYDPYIEKHNTIEMVNLDELVKMSDIITLHVPRTPRTENIISADRIGKMKTGAILINISRGGLVDEEALYEALVSKSLFGAALDCFLVEPYEGKLIELDNIVLSSHMGSSALETRAEMERQAIENLKLEFARLGL